MSSPWLKFYPTDWRSDPALRMCGLAARGLWIEMLALMHEATPYGHLLVSGRSPTDTQIAVLAGAPSDQITDLIGELEAAGVFSRTKDGVIYSRKMTRMQKKAATARNNGRKGGNPTLCNNKVISALDNPQDKDDVKPQKPEARSQKEKRDTDVSQKPPDLFDAFWNAYPKKVGKPAARKNFDRAVKAGADQGEIVAGAMRYSQSPDVLRGFIKHPQGWLTDGRWADEAPIPQQPAQIDERRAFLRKIAGGAP